MISNISLQNFKAYQDVEITPCELNLFVGLNGMGKSTFLQSLLLLRQSYQRNLLEKGLLLNGEYVEIGQGKDAVFISAVDKFIAFELEWHETLTLYCKFKVQDNLDLLPATEIAASDAAVWQQALFKKNWQYLNTERIGPKTFFPTSAYHIEQIHNLGHHGEFTTHFIAKNQREDISIQALAHPNSKNLALLAQLDAWLSEITPNIRLDARLFAGHIVH